MGAEDFYEFQRLIGQPYTSQGPAYAPRGVVADAWEAANGRFTQLIEVWLHQPLTAAGFRGKAPRWVFGRGPVRPVLDLQRHRGAQLEEGLIDFTINWALWVEGFARQVSQAKRLTPQTAQAPFAGRIGQLMGKGEYDVWWAVTRDRVVRHLPPRAERDPPSPTDEVPELLRNTLIPMLTPIDTVAATIDAIERWKAAGWDSMMVWLNDPLDALREIAQSQPGP